MTVTPVACGLLALTDLEAHALVLLEGAEAAALDLGEVHEDVSRTVGRSDEAEAFSPLNHFTVPSAMMFPYCSGGVAVAAPPSSDG